MARKKLSGRYGSEDFLQELEDYTNEVRDLIEEECPSFAPGIDAKRARSERALIDFYYFAETYFPHYIQSKPSEFHNFASKRICEIVSSPKGCKEQWAAPRGEAKSTLVTQILPIWLVVRDSYLLSNKSPYKIIPIVMDSTEQAQTMLASIKAEFESNPRLKSDFAKVCGAGRVWNVGVILTANNIKIQAFGCGKKIRGLRHGAHRPKLIILDDIENDENVLSKEQRDKTYKYVTKAVVNLGPPDLSVQIIAINTILHHDSVASRLQNNPAWKSVRFSAIMRWPDRMDLWDEWEKIYLAEGEDAGREFYLSNKKLMDAGAKLSWSAMRTLIGLMELRAADHEAFSCEYQNDPESTEFAPFSNIQFWVQPSRDWVFFGSHDPSLGKNNKKSDPSASLVGGYDRESGKLCVVEAKIARIKPHIQIVQLIALQDEYQCLTWAMETIQFQEFFADTLVEKSAQQHQHVPITPITPKTDKDLRILSIQPYVEKGQILFSQNLLTLLEQLKHYPESAHDDGPDALEMLWSIARQNMRALKGIRTGRMRASRKDIDYGH
ncbi:hypothetical protein DTO96_102188 [Ephemeroptericola cinctiostellae]|uniref:Terminase large subunit gp17-like C-terminal domain-containing protein n=1 Tax=Ephemeroptericola cinctiostellae TaxID=2268024 RepID=A0A345DDJ6_9BURK|nr:phage terminase large subunit [Ephemeroptericola cinctiostellae]AXF86434.1 hypothetical protein DTO96_102188 [Ephemeroptericola cinctiostellae]